MHMSRFELCDCNRITLGLSEYCKISQASPAHARLGLGTVLKTLWDVVFFEEHMASEINRVLTSVLASLAD